MFINIVKLKNKNMKNQYVDYTENYATNKTTTRFKFKLKVAWIMDSNLYLLSMVLT